jgi:dipeptidyl aminopeptidase/acylaminoacyl peptidase
VENYFRLKSLLFLFTLGYLSSCGTFLSKNARAADLHANAKSLDLIPRELLFKNPERVEPQISPDGKRLAYCAPVKGVLNVWVRTLGQNDDVIITHEAKRGIEWYRWSPDSSQILYKQDSNGDENYHIFGINLTTKKLQDYTPFAGTKSDVLAIDKHFPETILIEINKDSPRLFDVYSLDLNSGALTLIAKNPGNVRTWLADRKFQVRAAVATHENGKQSILVRDDQNSDWKTLLNLDFEDTIADELYCGLLGFSRDGEYLYLNTSLGGNTRRLIKLSVKTGDQQVLAGDKNYDVSGVYFNGDNYEPDIVSWHKDRLAHQVLNDQFRQPFERMSLVSKGVLDSIQHDNDGTNWILGFMHDNRSYEYYRFDLKKNESKHLFDTRPELNRYALSFMEPISYMARDGSTIKGYLSRPAKVYSEKLPLILLVHGGPFTRDVWQYHPTVQWLTNRGYACLQVNYRGSSGYGKEFLAAGNGEWANKMHHDLIDGVQWAIEKGIADPKRIGIFGGSYGGYAALVGATFTPDVFSCAVDYVGPSNLITLLNSIPPYWPLGPWEKRIGPKFDQEFLKSRSPLFKVDQIKIPIFVAHGAHDVRVTLAESEQLVKVLKTKGIPHEYLVFNDEGHGFKRPENKLIFYKEVEKFLAKYLDGIFSK